jgi:hypothetical protein
VNKGLLFGYDCYDDRRSGAARMLFAMRNDRLLVALAVVAGIVLIVIAIVYFAEPAKSLPGFFPGHQAGSGHHHAKHGIAALVVGLGCFVFAWFRTGPKRTVTATS